MTAPCFNCRAPSDHNHHVVPRSLGGVATVPLCAICHGKAHGREGGFRNTRELTRAALAVKRAKGERTGTVPYGFTADASGRLSEHDGEQAVIREARALRVARYTQRAIVDQLAKSGVVGRTGRPLALLQVQQILRAVRRILPTAQQSVATPQPAVATPASGQLSLFGGVL